MSEQLLNCSLCKQDKDSSCFHRQSTKARGFQSYCKECRKKRQETKAEEVGKQAWAKINRKYYLKCQYGLSLEQFDDLLKVQNYSCKICKTDERDVYRGSLFVDHCHTTGKIRGLLCHQCNTALGKFRDSETILLSAIEYLKENKDG